jgi:hypothetical protein
MAPLPFAFVLQGVAAVLIILVVLAVLVLGAISLFRLTTQGAKKIGEKVWSVVGPRRVIWVIGETAKLALILAVGCCRQADGGSEVRGVLDAAS